MQSTYAKRLAITDVWSVVAIVLAFIPVLFITLLALIVVVVPLIWLAMVLGVDLSAFSISAVHLSALGRLALVVLILVIALPLALSFDVLFWVAGLLAYIMIRTSIEETASKLMPGRHRSYLHSYPSSQEE